MKETLTCKSDTFISTCKIDVETFEDYFSAIYFFSELNDILLSKETEHDE